MSNYIEDFRARMDQQMEELTAKDTEAKEAGTLVGRYIRESVADGSAYYRVVKVTAGTATVEHVDYCDGYRIEMVEILGCKLSLKYVRENIERRDYWAETFGTDRL